MLAISCDYEAIVIYAVLIEHFCVHTVEWFSHLQAMVHTIIDWGYRVDRHIYIHNIRGSRKQESKKQAITIKSIIQQRGKRQRW